MTWSYNVSQLASSPVSQVRRLIGDVLQTDQLLQDEEIAFALTLRASIFGAGAEACRMISANYARDADSVQKDMRTLYSQRAGAFARQAQRLELQAMVRSGALPYAGGLSVADKTAQEQDADRVTPQFNLGMDDNSLPVGAAGTELPQTSANVATTSET